MFAASGLTQTASFSVMSTHLRKQKMDLFYLYLKAKGVNWLEKSGFSEN